MRLGLLGPALGQEEQLTRAALGLRDRLGATRVVYLGADYALDQVVRQMAEQIVGQRAEDQNLMQRATEVCLSGTAREIDSFVAKERERNALRMFESVAGETTRSVELLGGKVAVLLHDKAYLVEDDILPASLLIFGKSREPLLRQVGRRWFLSPGMFPEHGVMLLEETDGQLRVTSYGQDWSVRESRELDAPQSLRMRVVSAN